MSHNKLREEKNCLNCGREVEELYCPHCGQENLKIHDSAFHLILHYIQDLFHYDGRLWHTLKNLILKPGQVAKEYMEGKRRQNLEPIRFYVFTSTVFFLVLFFVVGAENSVVITNQEHNYSKRIFHLEEEKKFRKDTPDTIHLNPLIESLKHMRSTSMDTASDSTDAELEIDLFAPSEDTIQAEGWIQKLLLKKLEAKRDEMNKEYEGDEGKALRSYLVEVFHKLPQLFFLSMPFVAFFLMLLYWGSKKNTYVEHFIFSIYNYGYLFAILTLYLLAGEALGHMEENIEEKISSYLTLAMVLYPFIYLYLAMKRFYMDTWGKLMLRYFILLFLFVFIILFLFFGIAVFTLLW